MNHPPCKTIESPAPEGQLKIFQSFLMATAQVFESTLFLRRSLRFLHYIVLFALYPNPFFCIFELNAAPVNLSEVTKVNELRLSTAKTITQLCWYNMYVRELSWSLLLGKNGLRTNELAAEIINDLSSDPEFIILSRDHFSPDRDIRSWMKSLGNESRLKALRALLKTAFDQQFAKSITDLVKINLIQELCAAGLQREATDVWRTLDQERYTPEWMQYQFLVSIVKSTSRKNSYLIDEYVKIKPQSLYGHLVKLVDMCTAPAKNDIKINEERRLVIRALVKFILQNFKICEVIGDYGPKMPPFREDSLTYQQALHMFNFLCEISLAAEAKEISDFSEKFQEQSFFGPQTKEYFMQKSEYFKDRMTLAYKNLLQSSVQKGKIESKIFEMFASRLLDM